MHVDISKHTLSACLSPPPLSVFFGESCIGREGCGGDLPAVRNPFHDCKHGLWHPPPYTATPPPPTTTTPLSLNLISEKCVFWNASAHGCAPQTSTTYLPSKAPLPNILPTLTPRSLFLFVFPVELARLLWQIYNSGVKVFRRQQINLTPPPPLASPSPDKKTHSHEQPCCVAPTVGTPPTASPHNLSCVICLSLFFFLMKIKVFASLHKYVGNDSCVHVL